MSILSGITNYVRFSRYWENKEKKPCGVARYRVQITEIFAKPIFPLTAIFEKK